MKEFYLIRTFILATLSFIVTILWTPLLTAVLYKYKLGKQIRAKEVAPIFSRLHEKKAGTPTMGGVLVWGTTLILSIFFLYIGSITGGVMRNFNFLSRSQTLLPLGVLIASALAGLVDDFFDIFGVGHNGGGLRMKHRFIIYTLIATVGAWWFYFKLDWTVLYIPFFQVNLDLGWWFIPLFIFIIIATAFSVNEIDGLDGLAGGTLLTAYSAFGAIAFTLGKYDLAAFCAVIVGALVSFLWFNINPARFFMGDTGTMALGVTLGVVAILTNYVLLLPIIGFLFVVESLSVIIQVASKKIRKKKVFLSAPIHHHLEAIGWSEPKIVMRFWLISGVASMVGLILFLLDRVQ